MDLFQLGWTPAFEAHFRSLGGADLAPARVATQHRGGYRVYCAQGEWTAEVSGRFRHETVAPADFPAVGDWVAVEPLPHDKCVIQAILPRRTKFSRTAAGRDGVEQIVATNIDDVMVVAALSSRLNLRRLERSLALAWESGADPIIVLTKADLCPNCEQAIQEITAIVRGVPVYAVSSQTGFGLAELEMCLRPGRTVALLGPSGVGKSTLINRWCGDTRLEVQPVRETDQKGRHTTTRRQLVCLPSGGLIIDTPGMRELQLWEGDAGMTDPFDDVAELARRCRFADCRHETEPGCAVLEAVQAGQLDPARFESHQKLRRELDYFERRHNKQALAAERKRIKTIHKQARSSGKGQDQ